MFIKKTFWVLVMLTLVGFSHTGQILPDGDHYIQISTPHAKIAIDTLTTSTTLTLGFKLPTGSKGLTYGQYIQVAFPKCDVGQAINTCTLGEANFKFGTAGYFSCALYSGTNLVETTAVVSLSGEEHIANCKITDASIVSSVVPLVAGVSYRLLITLPSTQVATQRPSAIFWRNFDLYTTTGLGSLKQVIDSGIGFGSAAIFADQIANSNAILGVSNFELLSSSNVKLNTIYQYQSFNANIYIKIAANMRAGADLKVNFQWPDSKIM